MITKATERQWIKASLAGRVSTSAKHPDMRSWQPQRFDPSDVKLAAALAALMDSCAVTTIHDEITAQISGLVETRHPAKEDPSEADIAGWAEEHLAGRDLHGYGEWIFFPWSGRLVHVLPEDEFRELRTSRNRNKITSEEQDRLRAMRLGIVGLSVGQATACTLALEEIGGTLKLADFDHLELSNMNRLRTGVHELGVNKAVLTAREIFEINPFAKVEVFEDGINEDNINRFFLEGGKLDLLYDECDGLAMKVRLRKTARSLGIPVLMETSDRGMLDIERFDLEPQRPLFHGLVGELKAEELAGLSAYEKVPTIMKIIGQKSMSDRLAASLVDVGTSLNTWPQLASAVALGGAINADATRRICLGSLSGSGRFYADLEQIVSNDNQHDVGHAPNYEVEISEESTNIELPHLSRMTDMLRLPDLKNVVAHGLMAPSGGNCQPWRLDYDMANQRLTGWHMKSRSANFLDFEDAGSHMAFGALIENLDIAARESGLATQTEMFPAGTSSDCAFHMNLAVDYNVVRDPLASFIDRRCTNRRLSERVPLSAVAKQAMGLEASVHGGRLTWIEDEDDLQECGSIIGSGDRMRLMSKRMHGELMSEVRWTRSEVEQTRDGLDVATLELTPTDLAGMRLISKWQVMAVAGRLGGGAGLEKPSRKSARSASAIGLLCIDGEDSPADRLRGGRAMQRAWLAATQHGLAFQPMTAITFLFRRLDAGGVGFSRAEIKCLRALRSRYERLFDLQLDSPAWPEVMLFRVAKAGPPSARSLRMQLDDVLSVF